MRREIDGKTPLIGFAGAPYTLASYVVEGGHTRDYAHVKTLMFDDPATFDRLMELLAEVVAGYLLAQIEAGAQAVQLFDSWVGWLGPYDYERHRAAARRATWWTRCAATAPRSSTSPTGPRACSTS